MLYLGLASPAIVKAAPADQEDGSRTGNILLHDYFLQRYLELHRERTMFPGSVEADERLRRPFDPMAEQVVSAQVRMYINELEQKLRAMKSTVKELESVRQEAVSDQSIGNPATRARVRELAEDVGDRAGDLYSMVAIVAFDLRAKDASPPPPSSGADFFKNELRYLRKQVGKAEGRLKALFLQPTYTVDLEELRGDNVLTELRSIEQVSEEIKKRAIGPPDHTDKAE